MNTVNASLFKLGARPQRQVCFAILIALLLHGCGFHLRGSGDSGGPLPPTAVVGNAIALQVELRRQLLAGKTEVAEVPAAAQWVVRLLREESDQRVLSVGSTGRVEEYELYYAATFVFEDHDGKAQGEPQSVRQTRSYGFSETAVLGKDAEQETLMKDMRREVANQIVRRLRALAKAP